jgi:hypothetical protein
VNIIKKKLNRSTAIYFFAHVDKTNTVILMMEEWINFLDRLYVNALGDYRQIFKPFCLSLEKNFCNFKKKNCGMTEVARFLGQINI